MLEHVLAVLQQVLTSPAALGLGVAGVVVGIIFGALPGISSTMAIAVLLPLTFGMDAALAMMFLMGVFNGSVFGGSISAILVNIPGTPGAIVTQLDGHPMAKSGRAGEALGYASLASGFGGLFGFVVFMTVAPLLAAVALRFQSPEFTALALLGLASLSAAMPGSTAKGILAGAFGLLVATVGFDPVTNVLRLDFGFPSMAAGITLIPVAIGIFGMTEVLSNLEAGVARWEVIRTIQRVVPPWSEMKRTIRAAIRGAVVGTCVGIIPAAGSAIGVVFTYIQEKRLSRHPERFGTGVPEGIVAPESSNNAGIGGSLIPMMTLGIPGDTMTAVLMGALLIQGLRPGPLLFRDHPGFVAAVYVALGIAIVITTLLGLLGARTFARVVSVPKPVLLLTIAVLCVVGSYAVNNSLFDVGAMMTFAVLGYLGQKAGFPVVPVVFGLILGPMFEENLRRTLILSGGSWLVFVQRPISLTLLGLAVLTAAYPIYLERRQEARHHGTQPSPPPAAAARQDDTAGS